MTEEVTALYGEKPFGAESRAVMLDRYFSQAGALSLENAWEHVYRLLLWVDRTTGLAHCYESDKAQPGRPWYGRSLLFHSWVSQRLGSTPDELAGEIDWLFKEGTSRLAAAMAARQAARLEMAEMQREPYRGTGMPLPGEDPELEALVREGLRDWLSTNPPAEVMRSLTDRIRTYLSQENKRKNLVGEGFEDVLGSLIRRLPGADDLEVRARPLLHDLPGFNAPAAGEKPRRVDLAIITSTQRRVLISAKWSVRADREEQFGVDFETYARLENRGEDFDFVLVTNEFDAARLVAACRRRRLNAPLFSSVVHVNPEGPMSVYGRDPRRSAAELPEQLEKGRLISLRDWLGGLVAAS